MAEAVYSLCALTSLLCALMLLRAFWRGGPVLLLWSGLCFVGLAVNNALLFVDLVLVPGHALFTWRSVASLAGIAVLVYGLIMDVP